MVLKEEGKSRKRMIELANARKQNEIREERALDQENRRRAEKERIEEQEREKKKLEDYKTECRKQLEENKQQREIILARELEEDNRPPKGNDLMQVIYNVKPHQAYVRRERNDKQLEMIVKKLEEGDTAKKLAMEQ